ncbi:MAG: M81 family metallopeptidase [Spirochaetes bacterium]|nr:M81 family metallopeptidase [Spirochaetota bacterium]
MKRTITVFSLAALLPLCAVACKKEQPAAVKAPRYRVAMAEVLQETNSFSPVITTEETFRSTSPILTGDAIIPFSKKEKLELGGFIAAVEELGKGEVGIVPILKARSMSGGPVERRLYERFRKDIVEGLKRAGRVDGVYLSLHGAMGVEGMRDPEGDLLAAVRGVVGNSMPVGISHDLHACVTKRRAKLATYIVGYHTNPHRDHYDTGYRAGEILVKAVRGQVHPVMVMRRMKLLKGGGMTIDFLSPMRKVFSRMSDMEDEQGVLSVSNFMVHIWLDDPELSWTTVAVTDNNRPLAEKLADEIADMDWAVRTVQPPKGNTPEEAVEIVKSAWLRRKLGTVVFCDASDAVGTGTPGESTWILRALLEKGPELVSYVPIRDAVAASEAFHMKLGDKVTLSVGGRLDRVYNRPVTYSGELVYKKETRLGKTAILKDRGIHLILTEYPDSAQRTSYFTDLGLSLWKADVVVVKNLFPFRFFYLLYNRKTVNVMSPGMSNVDVFALRYKKITRPLYPLDDIKDWR